MNKYTQVVTEINPMETAPLWGYYDGDVETVILFIEHPKDGSVVSRIGYFNRDCMAWVDYYSRYIIEENIVGWLPDLKYVKGD